MDPPSWGPYYWALLHISALTNTSGFPELVQLFPALIPCPTCSEDFRKIIADYPLTGDYFTWSVDVHNLINRKLGKPQVSYEDARRQWTTPTVKSKANWVTLAVLAAVLFILIVALRRS